METKQTPAPLERMSVTATARTAHGVAQAFTEGHGDLNPEYQRGAVWTQEQKVGLIHSFMLGIPIPAVILNDRLFGPWPEDASGPISGFESACIDGKQRIMCLQEWFAGQLPVPASWFHAENVETTVPTDDGAYVSYAGLSESTQRIQRNNWVLPVVEARLATLQEEANLFLLVNMGGTEQDVRTLGKAAEVASGASSTISLAVN